MTLLARLRQVSHPSLTLLAGLLSVAIALVGPVFADVGYATPRSAVAAVPEKPNIIVIMADDMRADDLRYMPRVRRLIGDDGVTFENSFSPYPLCCPARASFLTGQYAHNHEVFNNRSPYGFGGFDDSATIATAMQNSGYNTAFVGKYLNGYGHELSLVTGEASNEYIPAGWTRWFASIGRAADKAEQGSTYNYWFTTYNNDGVIDKSFKGQYQTKVLAQRGMELVDTFSTRRKPFFLYLSFVAPHDGGPREKGDPGQVEMLDGSYFRYGSPARPKWVRGTFDEVISHSPGLPADGGPAEADLSDKPAYLQAPEFADAERDALTNVARQRAETLSVLDLQVGRLVTRLKKAEEWQNTVLVFTSDNGYFLGEHRQRPGKIKPHEPSLRVPMVIRGPGISQGVVRYDPITTVDLTATLLDLAGALGNRPHPSDGISRVPTLTSGDQGWLSPVVTEGVTRTGGDAAGFDDPRTYIGIRTPRYSFIRYATGETELYDLIADPNEFESKHDDPSYAAVLADLTDLWYQFKDCAGAACHNPMPGDLQASPSEEAQMTRYFWDQVYAVYGY